MYFKKQVEESMKLLYVVDMMKGDPKARPAGAPTTAVFTGKATAPVFTPKPRPAAPKKTTVAVKNAAKSEWVVDGKAKVDVGVDAELKVTPKKPKSGSATYDPANDFGDWEDQPDDDWEFIY